MSGRLVEAMMTMPLMLIETIHLDEQLIERLILIGRSGIVAAPALAAQSVNLINEDDAGREFARFGEETAHARRAESGKFLLKARTGD